MSDAEGIGTEGPWRIASEQQLRELLGRPLECPQPLSLSQERINRFAEVVEDPQWIHVDPERAARESPFGSTIAHGFLTLSMLTWFLERTVIFEGSGAMRINYGLDRVRFIRAVRSDTPLRGRFLLTGLDEHDWGVHLTWDAAITEVTDERQGWARPALAARWLTRWYSRTGA